MMLGDTGKPLSREELLHQLTAPGAEFEMGPAMVDGREVRTHLTGAQTLRELGTGLDAADDRLFHEHADQGITFGDLARRSASVAAFLVESGVTTGDRVAVSLRNGLAWGPLVLGVQAAGAVLVPLNSWWTGEEIAYALEDSGSRVVVVDADRLARLNTRPESLSGRVVVTVDVADRPAGCIAFDDVISRDRREFPDVMVAPDDVATILYTSGTTGRPKGAVGTHRNHCANLRTSQLSMAVSALMRGVQLETASGVSTGTLCTYPFFHAAGMNHLLLAVANRSPLLTQHRWDPDTALDLVHRYELGAVGGVPTVMADFIRAVVERPEKAGSVTRVSLGGAAAAPALVTQLRSVLGEGLVLANGYGLTETTSTVTINSGPDYLLRPDSVGRCVPGTAVRVVDPDTGTDLPDGATGELWFRGPTVVRGYWNNEAATAEAFLDGWFRTGDLGFVRDGFVHICDRMKDVVIRGGENVYSAEVEAALLEHPAVLEAAVVGVPHERLGEEVAAVVVTRREEEIDLTELRSHLSTRLAEFKLPTVLGRHTGPLPRNAAGKVLKRDLRTVAAAAAAGRNEAH